MVRGAVASVGTRRSSRIIRGQSVGQSAKSGLLDPLEHSDNSTQENTSDSESDSELEQLAARTVRQIRSHVLSSSTATRTPENVGESSGMPSDGASLFLIDKTGGYVDQTPTTSTINDSSSDTETRVEANSSDEEQSLESENEKQPKTSQEKAENRERKDENRQRKKKKKMLGLASSLKPGISTRDTYLETSGKAQLKNAKIHELLLKSSTKDEIMKKSVLTSDLEKKDSLPPYEESIRQLKKQRKKQRDTTKGAGWYDLPATELTEERKNDLLVIKMRKALDPKRFYKAPDLNTLPKYFQTGTVVEDAADFYHSRIPKKQRKQTLVDELMQDSRFMAFNKRKYTEITESKKKAQGAFRHMKRMKKSKK